MDWLENLQNSIEYIEAHLLDDEALKTEEISKQAFSSEFNFRTIFRVITGYAVGEYIRNRRLALAGEELVHSDESILKIAYKYGYDTPESFTKAFQRFHGVSPSYVRKNHQGLKTFTRLVLRVQAVGGSVLNYCIEDLGDIYVLGYENTFLEEQMEENRNALPGFVQKCKEIGFANLSPYALSGDYEDAMIGYRYHSEDRLKYVFGVSVDAGYFETTKDVSLTNGSGKGLPDCGEAGYPLICRRITAKKWIRFQCDDSGNMQELWHRIYTEFLPFSSYRFGDRETMEVSYKKNGEIKKVLYLPLL